MTTSPTIKGIDISEYQGDISDPVLASHGFAFAKVTEGTGYTNPYFQAQRAAITGHGLVLGLYHFPWTIEPVAAQVSHFLNQAHPAAGDVIALDFEGYSDDRNWKGQSWAERDAWRLDWLKAVRQALGGHCRVGTYCNVSTWKAIPSDDPGDFLWIAWPEPSSPPIKYPWTFWQTGQRGVDQDVARFASETALRAWASPKGTAPPAPAHRPAAIRWHRNVSGDTYARIAAEYKVFGGSGTELYAYQLKAGVRPLETRRELASAPHCAPRYELSVGGETAIPPEVS